MNLYPSVMPPARSRDLRRPTEILPLHERPTAMADLIASIDAIGGWSSPDLPYAGIVSLGGSMGAYEDAEYEWMPLEKKVLADAVAAGVPVLGLCLGAQMLSAALGGRVFLSPKPEVGFPIIRLTAEGESHPLLATVTDAFAPTEGGPGKLCLFHQDTFTLPPGATLLAQSDLYPQIFSVGSALAIQFHPEATPAILTAWTKRAVSLRPKFLSDAGVNPDDVITQGQTLETTSKAAGLGILCAWVATLQ